MASHHVFVSFVILIQIVLGSSISPKESLFFHAPLCDMEDRLTRECARPETGVVGLSHCSVMCNLDDTCVGASTDEDDNCYLHQECPDLIWSCSVTNTNYEYMAKHCANGGTWLTSDNRCQCVDGMVGTSCETHPETCFDLISYGYQSGQYDLLLRPRGIDIGPVHAKCTFEFANTDVASLLFYNVGKDNFNRTWQEYRDGFEVSENNYFIGLESIYRQTKTDWKKMVIYIRFKENPLEQAYRVYSNFKLSNETSGYRISFDSSYHKGNGAMASTNYFGDCFGEIQDTPFSTWDRDQDQESSTNCALDVGSGWWFSDSCNAKCNVFGYYPDVSGPYPHQQQMRVEGVKDETYQTYVQSWVAVAAHLLP